MGVHLKVRRCVVEVLEPRRLFSLDVSGTVIGVLHNPNGTVRDVPLAGVEVEVTSPMVQTTTDSSGNFSLHANFIGGVYQLVEVPPSGYQYSAGESGARQVSATNSLQDYAPITGVVFYNDAIAPPAQAAPDLTIFGAVTSLPSSCVAGYSGGMAAVAVKNNGIVPAVGTTDITLYASAPGSAAPSPGDPVIATHSTALHLLGGKGRIYQFKYALPANLTPGTYTITAAVNTGGTIAESNTANNGGAIPGTIHVAAPVWDLGITLGGAVPSTIPPAKGAALPVVVTNTGNIPASGAVVLSLYASASGALDSSAVLLRTLTMRLNMKPGQQKVVRLAFHGRGKQNAIAAGNYRLIATLSSPLDMNAGNNVAVGTGATAFA